MKKSRGLGITLRNNEIKDIIEAIRSLENRGILLKETTGKIISQEEGLLNFIGSLMKVGLPLTKNVLAPLAKSVMMPLKSMAATNTADLAIEKNFSITPLRPKSKKKFFSILRIANLARLKK